MAIAPLLPNGAARSIVAALPDGTSLSPALHELARHLDAFVDGATLAERTDGLVQLAAWTRVRDRELPLPDGEPLGPGEANPALRRMAFLIRLLEISPPLRVAVRSATGHLLDATEGAAAMADTGLGHDRGFFGEALRRLTARVLPAPREAYELGPLLARVYSSDQDLARLRHLPIAWFSRLAAAFAPGEAHAPWAALSRAAGDAISLLATRIEAQALSPRLWPLAPTRALRDSPFLALGMKLEAHANDADSAERVAARLEACRAELRTMEHKLEDTGVTISVVHSLESVGRAVDRLEALLAVRIARPESRVEAGQKLLTQIVDAQLEARGVRRLTSDTLRLLARRIVEGHGRAGEHYIARSRGEYVGMWRAALGGGLVTVATAAIKLRIALLGLAALPEGLLGAFNYSASFLFLLAMHFALATKQPSMTAAALAGIVRTASGPKRLDLLVDQVAATVRTQLAAAIGNVAAVAVGALALDLGLRALTGQSLIGTEKAEHVLHSFHPILSGTIPYAALTGVILWASGLIGGWFENWATAHRLPEAIAQHPLGKRFGRARMQRAGEAFAQNASSWGGSVALGTLLGLTPSLGKFMGLPLDVRHVTLSSGMLAFAASSLARTHLAWSEVAWAAAGVGVIFVLNLAVSFLLALALALRAQDVPPSEALRLARKVLGRFVRSPWQFIGPPAAEAPSGSAQTPPAPPAPRAH